MFDRYHELYIEDLERIQPYISQLCTKKETRILITGATGLIGTQVVDALRYFNKCQSERKVKIYALTRSKDNAVYRLGTIEDLGIIEQSICEVIPDNNYDYIIHLASNANPELYEKYPFETIETNVLGAIQVERYLRNHKNTKAMVASSMEVYGEIDSEGIKEEDYGRLDFNRLRAGYPESKRTMELLFKSSAKEYGTHSVIARFGYIYGPTMLDDDNKVICEMIRAAKNNKPIYLKTAGEQRRTYCYVRDVVSAIFVLLNKGEDGKAYNVANNESISIAEIAKFISGMYELDCFLGNECVERTNNDVVLDSSEIQSLGWIPEMVINSGIERTVTIK